MLLLNPFCAFLSLREVCFSHLYDPIDKFVAKEFGAIFGNVAQASTITEADARNQYANYMTVIDQILWHLGSDVAVEECLTKKVRKKPTRKKKSTTTQQQL